MRRLGDMLSLLPLQNEQGQGIPFGAPLCTPDVGNAWSLDSWVRFTVTLSTESGFLALAAPVLLRCTFHKGTVGVLMEIVGVSQEENQ